MCIFGHKFGPVQTDGFQYCAKCGNAKKPTIPHPCADGHTWKDDRTENYVESSYNRYGGGTSVDKRQTFQTCTRCGSKRNIWG